MSGVGPATKSKLNSVGVNSIEDLTDWDSENLSDEAGVSSRKASDLIETAKQNAVIIQSGQEVVDEHEKKETYTTGMDDLDDLLGGGIREGHIVGISGEPSAGKTQMCFQMLCAAVEATGKPAVYIETERERYEPERIQSIANDPDIQDKIYRVKAYDLDTQYSSYGKIEEMFDEISLVVVDSFTSRFRLSDKFEGRGSLSERSNEFSRHLTSLEKTAEALQCPILLTLQVYGNPSQYGGANTTYGGALLQHTVGFNIHMKNAQGSLSKAQLRGHPGEGDGEVHINITDDGLEAMKNA